MLQKAAKTHILAPAHEKWQILPLWRANFRGESVWALFNRAPRSGRSSNYALFARLLRMECKHVNVPA
jgi:hypothetical protein